MCSACGKKLTAGFPKGRNGRQERYARYWCWNPKCTARVGVSRDELELAFLRILAHMAPTQELLNRLPEIAKEYWAKRLERIKDDTRRFSAQIAEATTLNQNAVLQKVRGELSPEDFVVLKEHVQSQKAEAEAQLQALDNEAATMEALLEETQHEIVDLVGAWRRGDTERKRELAFSLFPEGMYFGRETAFFEPRNTWL